MKIIFYTSNKTPQNMFSDLCGASIYQTKNFLSFLQHVTKTEPYCLMAIEDGKIIGFIYWLEKHHSSYGTVVNSLPWYGSYGGCALAEPDDHQTREALVKAYASHLQGIRDLLSTVTILSPFESRHLNTYQSCLPSSLLETRNCQITKLPPYSCQLETELMQIFDSAKRRAVKKSLRQGFTFAVVDDEQSWKFLAETHQENIAAIGGKVKPATHFEALRHYLPPERRELTVALVAGRPVAALLLLLHHKTIEYVTPVIVHDYRPLQPLSYLIWHGMLCAIRRGYKWWNWGGTWRSQQSLHRFKAGWGSMDVPYYYIIQAADHLPYQLGKEKTDLLEAFPWFYLYPFYQLPNQAELPA
jgi:hypothetical protein